jgi:predicted ester cyclase
VPRGLVVEGETMSQQNKALVRRLFEEIFTGDRSDASEKIMAEDYVEHAVEPFGTAEPGRVHGPSHAREVVAWLRGQFPDLEMTIEAIVAEDDMVAVRVRSEGTNLGRLGGIAPPTNKRFAAQQTHWYRVADGRLCEHWATRDDLAAMLQLGVIHRPGPPAAS